MQLSYVKRLGLCALAGLLFLTGCKTVQESSSRFIVSFGSDVQSSTDSGAAASDTTVSQGTPTAVTGNVNALTGEPLSKELSRQRPLAVAMNNLKYALPQNGISKADLVIESEVAGGITRLLAFYTDWDGLSKVGSIRELTPCLADLAQSFDAIPLHTESVKTTAAAALKSRAYTTLNAAYYNEGTLAYRDEALKATRSIEHTLVSSGALVRAVADDIELRTTYRDDVPVCWFSFYSSAVTPTEYRARAVYLNYGMAAHYQYDNTKAVYQRYVSGGLQTDLNDGSFVEVSNIIVLFASQTADSAGEVTVDFASGEGYYFTRGSGQKIYWQRGRGVTDRLMLYDIGGIELKLNVGKSWITIMPTTAAAGVSWSEIGA